MSQSRLGSLTEAVINVVVGYGIAVLTQIFVFPWFGIHASVETNLVLGAIFTVVSLARSYALRRIFNALQS